jgi:hypothetical protein
MFFGVYRNQQSGQSGQQVISHLNRGKRAARKGGRQSGQLDQQEKGNAFPDYNQESPTNSVARPTDKTD